MMRDLVRNEANGCPDAEMLAAWSEGGLRPEERASIEAHAANCPRCQAHLMAMVRTEPAALVPAQDRRRLRLWPWLVPITSAAAAVVVWFIVQPPRSPDAPQAPAQLQVQAEDRAAPSTVPGPSGAGAATPEEKAPEPQSGSFRQANRLRRLAKRPAPPPAPAAEMPPAAVPREEALAATAAADAFAITGLKVHRAPDGQVRWDRESSGLERLITAAASPSPSVIWLVGRRGLVLLTVDGRSWQRRTIPEATDLTAVQASSAAAATVTAANGRTFATTDGGLTWTSR